MPEETILDMEPTADTSDFWDSDMSDAFVDGDAETTQTEPQTQEEEKPAEQGADQTRTDGEAQPEQPRTFKVRYNGQDMDVPESDAVTLIQKGMNYDHVLQERDSLRNAPERALISTLAAQSGKTVEQYMKDVQTAMDAQKLRALTSQGLTEQAAKQVLDAQNEAEQAKKERDALKAQLDQSQPQIARQQMLRDFFAAHTDLAPKDIPQEILQKVSQGENMESAWTAYQTKQLQAEIENLKAQLAAKDTANANKSKAVGSMANASDPGDSDDEAWNAFMKG